MNYTELLDDGTYEEIFTHINLTIFDGNAKNISLIAMARKYGAIDTDDSSCHGYYIIKFYSSPYTLQEYLIIDKKVIYSGEMVCEGTFFFPININYHFYVLPKKNMMDKLVS